MLPGVDIASLPDFNKGDLLAVCVPGNPAPVAVGAAVMNSMAAKGQVRGHRTCSGHGVVWAHCCLGRGERREETGRGECREPLWLLVLLS
jgi:hypothetical protein